MEVIDKYFPGLTALQRERFAALGSLYAEWNARINVISRKDMEHFYVRHVLHSLAIAKACPFGDSARIVDIGTGGGFPGIPLAIMFPGAHFTLTDSIGKKITVVHEVAQALQLDNVQPLNGRVESVPGRFDYAVTRAVAEAPALVEWAWGKLTPGQKGGLANGLICLKGGDLGEELAKTGKKATVFAIGEFFDEEFFETKKVVHISR